MAEKRHKLLERQIKRLDSIIPQLSGPTVKVLEEFFAEVNAAYSDFENDRELLEHSMELSSTELFNANREMREMQAANIKNAHEAGMSEIATDILHNVGNVLNSVNVGAETLLKTIDDSSVSGLFKANELLKENLDDFSTFLTTDSRAKKLLAYYLELGSALKSDFSNLREETTILLKNLQVIKDIVDTQQTYAKGAAGFKEEVILSEAVEAAIAMQKSSLVRHEIEVVRNYSPVTSVIAEKTKLTHVIFNLIKNAKEAMSVKGTYAKKIITIEIGKSAEGIFLKVKDTGVGIAKENLARVFTHGFTTKQNGHGFGLHYCANAISEMDGKISVASDGVDRGTTMTILFYERIADSSVAA